MKRSIRKTVTYPHPVESVWAAVSDARALASWLMPNDFKAEVGHRFQFRDKPQPGWDGIVNCEVLACDAPSLLRYSWVGGPLDTQVCWQLEPTDGGTRVTFEHTGFEGLSAVLVSGMLQMGWNRMAKKLLPALLDRMAAEGVQAALASLGPADEEREHCEPGTLGGLANKAVGAAVEALD